jgi:hypothetical protein
MDERRSIGLGPDTEGVRTRRLPRSAFLVGVTLMMGWLLLSSSSSAQTNGAHTRTCNRLQAALERAGQRGSAAQGAASRLQRLGCVTTGPTTTVAPGSPTTTVPVCPLPGGGFGPCPTTTLPGGPATTVSPGTTVPGGPATTVSPGTTFVPSTTVVPTTSTTAPGGSTTSTTLPRCSPVTTTGVTTVPCVP